MYPRCYLIIHSPAYSSFPTGKFNVVLIPIHSQTGKGKVGSSPASDYSEGASHVLAVIHEILAHHRAVEQRWTTKKLKLHQRLALRLFQEDVKQVGYLLSEAAIWRGRVAGIVRWVPPEAGIVR